VKQVFIKKGEVEIDNVPAPSISDNEILVKVFYSCISAGTELAGIKVSGKPLYKKALDNPQYVKKVLEDIKRNSISSTFAKVKGRVESKNPVGYSASGIVVDVGRNIKSFSISDRVACAGAGIANHAEFIAVPKNLAVKVPEELSLKHASTVTLGSIALQGIRRCNPGLGENIVVIGLGILGQLTVLMLKLAGCFVIGIDLDDERIKKAKSNGLDIGLNSGSTDIIDEVLRNTNGHGADSVIITAGSKSSSIINQSMQICRKKGRVVIVGDVNLNLEREEFYKKELDLLISTSYGPGRYDEKYENEGFDYPYAYVRWTENRNMQAYLEFLSKNKSLVGSLIEKIYPVDRAKEAYNGLKSFVNRPLIVLLEYNKESKPGRKTIVTKKKKSEEKINVGLIGAGFFAKSAHLPNMKKMGKYYEISAICSKTGSNASAIAKQYNARYATTDYKEIIGDKNIDMVLIATRHNIHASLSIECLEAGKAVLVEKPMSINEKDLKELEKAVKGASNVFMVGYNRRFSPFSNRIIEITSRRTNPMVINYMMNAGFIPRDHWVHSDEGGGRNIGEACHIYDLFNYFTGGKVISVKASAINSCSEQYGANDNFVAIVKYDDGSVCNLIYTALGTEEVAKERMEIYVDNKIIYLNDYKDLKIFGAKEKGITLKNQDKGQYNELIKFKEAMEEGKEPIPLWQLVQASMISFEVENQISR
jgi:predicted dehydrogenase/threonine dehydrogenase-like Zn-dependent dehydrogenase